MEVKTFQFNPVGENTYVVYDETQKCVIIDAGCFNSAEETKLDSFIKDQGLTVKHVINTHLHFDHIFGVNHVCKVYNKELQAHEGDQILLDNYKAQLQMFGIPDDGQPAPVIGKKLTENDIIEFGNQTFKIFYVPGHSPGSIVFYNEAAKCLFVGDVLFQGSVGRSDLVGGDHELLISGIKDKLLNLPNETVVYSGHGPATSIGYEKLNNPFLR